MEMSTEIAVFDGRALGATALVPQRVAPMTPPVIMEAAIAPAAMVIRTRFMGRDSLLFNLGWWTGTARARIKVRARADGAL
jgi:hypothetical protein